MMPVQIFAIAASCLATFLVLLMLRRRSFRERHAAWWMLAGILGIVLAIFPQLLDGAARLLGIADPVNLALFGAVLILFLVGVQLSTEITSLEAPHARLAEESALQAELLDRQRADLAAIERGLERMLDSAPRGDRPGLPGRDGASSPGAASPRLDAQAEDAQR